MQDFVLDIRVKNGRLLSAMRSKGYSTAADLARACNIASSTVYAFLNLKEKPLTVRGDYKPSVVKISEELHTIPSLLFPEGFLDNTLKTNRIEKVLSSADMIALCSGEPNPQRILENRELKNELIKQISTLTKREQRILKARWGVGCEELMAEDLAREFGITKTRVHQIEHRALKKLRHPVRANKIK